MARKITTSIFFVVNFIGLLLLISILEPLLIKSLFPESEKQTTALLISLFITKHDLTGDEHILTTQQVVVEMGTQPIDDVFHELRGQSLNDGVTDVDAIAKNEVQQQPNDDSFVLHCIDDTVTTRSIHASILDAYRLAIGF